MDGFNQTHYKTIIIGAGPAGLQMAYCLARRGEQYVVLEAAHEVGEFFTTFPRHRKLISINKVHTGFDDTEINLRWDWNSLLSDDDAMLFRHFSKKYFPCADDMVKYLKAFSSHFNLNVRKNSEVSRIAKSGKFEISLTGGSVLTCDILVVATGRSQPNVPEIPGIELAEPYHSVSTDPDDFLGQRVFIIGKGNSAFETADNLVETTAAIHLASPENIVLAWKSHYVGHLRAVNNNVLDTYQLKSQNTIIDGVIESITPRNGKLVVNVLYSHAHGQRIEVQVDLVILCVGFKFNTGIFDPDSCPDLSACGTFPAMTSEWESVNVKDMYFTGTLMHSRDYEKTFSGFIHGFRYNIEVLDRFLHRKYRGRELPGLLTANDPRVLFEQIYRRVHTNSSLFQQPGFLCDIIALPEVSTSPECQYFKDLPVDYVHDEDFGHCKHYLMLTMEYGKIDYADPFNIERVPEQGNISAFIHPVLRKFKDQQLISEYHIPEDLENNWYQKLYMAPFYDYLCEVLEVDSLQHDLDSVSPPHTMLKDMTNCR